MSLILVLILSPFMLYGMYLTLELGKPILGAGIILLCLFVAFIYDHQFGAAADIRRRKESK